MIDTPNGWPDAALLHNPEVKAKEAKRDRAMTDVEAEAVASRLTLAQMRALLWLYHAPERVAFDDRLSLLYRDRWELVSPPFGWAVSNEPWQYSPLGLRVRAVLLAEAARND